MSQASQLIASQYRAAEENKRVWANMIINVKDYGALGNGEENDSVSIQKAIEVAAINGGVVFFPPGTFLCNLTLFNVSGVSFDGPGELKCFNPLNPNGLILIEDCKDITIKNIKITGAGNLSSAEPDDGITLKRTGNFRVTGCKLSNFSRNAISVWGQPLYDDNFKYPGMIDNNTIENNYVGVLINNGAEYFDITMNKIVSNSFGVYGGFGNINVRNNQISYNIYGLYLEGTLHSNADHNSISGNKINHNRAVGVKISNVVNRVHMVDNQIVSTVGPETYTGGYSYSVALENVKNLQVIGNQIDGGSGGKILISGHTQCHYIGNTFLSGQVHETIAGQKNYFIGNNYIGSGLVLHSSTTDTIRSYEGVNGVFIGQPTETINKNQVSNFLNSWANTGGVYESLCYWKDGEGTVHIQGTVSGGSAMSMITQLPAEYRPRKTMDRPTTAGDTGAHGSIRIYQTGDIQHTSGPVVQVHIYATFKP